jgi:HEAT repeat protein
VLRRFIPRRPPNLVAPGESRAAAIWALGLIHAGKPVAPLVSQLEDRLNDAGRIPIPPEDSRVRYMAAITLGRMRAKTALPSLQTHFRDRKLSLDTVNNACGWAVEQLTGEVMPRPTTIRQTRADGFLLPNE